MHFLKILFMTSLQKKLKLLLSPSQIYICGGFNGEESLQTGECYDPETNQWTKIASMGTHRAGLGVAAYVGHVYVVSAGSKAFSFLNPFLNDLIQCLFPLVTLKQITRLILFLLPLTGRWI